jgi:hypothetical protein
LSNGAANTGFSIYELHFPFSIPNVDEPQRWVAVVDQVIAAAAVAVGIVFALTSQP